MSLATCSQWEKTKPCSQVHPHPPARPAGFQGERTCRSSSTTATPPGLPYCQRAGLGQSAWKILGSHSILLGFSQAAVPPPSPTHC